MANTILIEGWRMLALCAQNALYGVACLVLKAFEPFYS